MKRITVIAALFATALMCVGCTDEVTESPALTEAIVLDETKALAETGDAAAQFELGNFYAEGKLVPNDFAEATKWFRKAAAQGYAEAMYYLGVIHSGGFSGPVDFAEGYSWFCLAAKSGFESATADCDELAKELSPEELVVANNRIDELSEEIQAREAREE